MEIEKKNSFVLGIKNKFSFFVQNMLISFCFIYDFICEQFLKQLLKYVRYLRKIIQKFNSILVLF